MLRMRPCRQRGALSQTLANSVRRVLSTPCQQPTYARGAVHHFTQQRTTLKC